MVILLLFTLFSCAASDDLVIQRFGNLESEQHPKNIFEPYDQAFSEALTQQPPNFSMVKEKFFRELRKIEHNFRQVVPDDSNLHRLSGEISAQYLLFEKDVEADHRGRDFLALTKVTAVMRRQHDLAPEDLYIFCWTPRNRLMLYIQVKQSLMPQLLALFPNIMPHDELEIANIAAYL